ncbi:Uncharacterized BCR, COG1636 [Haploplasma axanthum]|uniref:Epoxyqueuosine reductase QueH n=2 Tax=Haploplasma axanthum TaxID=29552 RepID=A0A449BE47_HAPAX|nr:Uncharacterized BCR, COG1636 [Haploplasma axanthum]
MHMCCAPCATFPVELLKEKGLDVEGLFYNPNIHPYEEFKKREEQVKKLSEIYKIKVHFLPDFEQQLWEEMKDKSKNRCGTCYQKRIARLFKFAKVEKFDAVTTSMLVSPYQDHEKIKELATMYSEKYGIPFYYEDFRVGYREGQEKAKEHGFYKQRYCGCVLSLLETIEQISAEEKQKRMVANG